MIINEWMYNRGRGPELRSTRLTVYDLIPYFESGQFTDEALCELFKIRQEELDALRQYIAEHHDEVMAANRRIDERIRREWEAQDTPENRERWRQSEERLVLFKEFLDERKRAGQPNGDTWEETRAAFRRWLDAKGTQNGVHSP
jgi:uncharacterized protein (DUF433 family)